MVGIFSFQAGEHELFPLFQLDRTARVDVELLHDQINLLVRVLEAHDIEGRLELSRIESAHDTLHAATTRAYGLLLKRSCESHVTRIRSQGARPGRARSDVDIAFKQNPGAGKGLIS